MWDAEQSTLEVIVWLDACLMLELRDLGLGADLLYSYLLEWHYIALILKFTAQGVICNRIFDVSVQFRLLSLMLGQRGVIRLHQY